jgi:hypothetical protein
MSELHEKAQVHLAALRDCLREMVCNDLRGSTYTVDNIYDRSLSTLESQITFHREFMERGGLDYDGQEAPQEGR